MPKISVRFYLSQKYKPSTNIMTTVNYNKTRVIVSTGLTIETKYWNPKTQRIKSSSPLAIHQNKLLENFANNVINSVYEKIASDGDVTKYDLKQITAIHSKSDNNRVNRNGLTLINAINECIKHKRKDGIRESTLKNYRTLREAIHDYELARKTTLLVKNISYGMVNDIIKNFLINERGLSDNAAYSYFTQLKAVFNFLRIHKEIQITEGIKKLKIKTHKSKEFTINENEFSMLMDYVPADEDIFNYKFKLLVRDRFLISVLTGLRFSDLNQINGSNQIEVDSDGNKWINFYDTKTGAENSILLDETIDSILERNNYNLFEEKRKVAYQHNKAIKQVFEEAGINRPFKRTKKINGVKTEITEPAYIFASTHAGRRSTVTFLRDWDVSDSKIMLITNHQKHKSIVGRYDNNDQKKARLEISELFAEKLGLRKKQAS
ncbi:MAG: phage integrase SAM-like domain-containing protein [Chlorobiota bacterium]